MSKRFKPTDYNSVSPCFIVPRAEKFITFIRDIFGATELSRYGSPNGTLMHAEIQIDDSILLIGDSSDQFPPGQLIRDVYASDVDEMFQKAMSAGCEVLE